MLLFPLVCGIVGIFLSQATALDSSLDEQWESFKIRYNRNYQYSPARELYRRKIWEKNVKFIANHNLQADLGVYSYWLGINEFADMTTKEFLDRLNSSYHQATRASRKEYLKQDVPESVDWREQGYVSPVKNQGNDGSTSNFATAGTVEGVLAKKSGKLLPIDPEYILKCENFGNVTERITAGGFVCIFDKKAPCPKTVDFSIVHPAEEELQLQKAVAQIGPIAASIDASRPSFMFYRSGVYNDDTCNENTLNHAILVVGYGSKNGQDYWIAKNSWGSTWGQNGYILMSRNKNNQCGIASRAYYPVF